VEKIMRGIFPVLQTPVHEDGEIDQDSLKKEVHFCIEAGAHGLVFPVLGSEFQYLNESERGSMVDLVVGETGGQIPVIAGVAGTSRQAAEVCARQAVSSGADAVIALPPYIAGPTPEQVRDYYIAIARIVERPVFIQHTAGGLTASLMAELFAQEEHILYLKEEAPPSAHQISSVVKEVTTGCLGVFAGGHSRWMMSELHRGATGFMPAVEGIDIHVQIWDAYQAGDEAKARALFNQLLPQINLVMLLGLKVCKEILVRRGVFKSSAMRMPGAHPFDADDARELDAILEDLRPLHRV
jgi:dihydrodipicolinate synthase/N-acetylneuraminate lyase